MYFNPNVGSMFQDMITQNAQRSNPALQVKAKEQKLSKPKNPHTTRTNVDMDSTNLSGDMLGDMDPDRGHRDNTGEFKRQMKEWREEPPPGREEKTEEEDPETEEKADEYSRKDEKEGNGGFSEEEEEMGDEGDEAPEPAEIIAGSEEIMLPQNTGETALKIEEPVDAVALEKWDDDEELFSKGKDDEIPGEEMDFELEERKEKEKVEALKGSQEFVSLLSYNDGFLLADDVRKIKPVEDEEDETAETILDGDEEEKGNDYSELSQRYRNIFTELILSDSRGMAYERLCQKLSAFSPRALETCIDKGGRILILSPHSTIEDHAGLLRNEYGPFLRKIRCGYFYLDRLMVIGEEKILNSSPQIDVITLYFAHVYDHLLGGEGFASENSPMVMANYQACQDRLPGHQFIDSFSAESPLHYFAQTMEAFLTAPSTSGGSAGIGPVCTREELYDMDRSMYSYLEHLLEKDRRI